MNVIAAIITAIIITYCYIHRKDKQQWQIPHETGVVRKTPVFFVRGNQFEPLLTTSILLVRSYYTLSKIWIRLFSMSDTAILPSLRFAVDLGLLNSPI